MGGVPDGSDAWYVARCRVAMATARATAWAPAGSLGKRKRWAHKSAPATRASSPAASAAWAALKQAPAAMKRRGTAVFSSAAAAAVLAAAVSLVSAPVAARAPGG